MENKIEFNWEKYQSGEYDCITRDGRKVEKLRIIHSDSPYKIYCVISNDIERFTINGYFLDDGSKNNFDLFLIPKEEEDHFADIGQMVIPELKGVLMEVSDYEDFKVACEEMVLGTYKGIFITDVGEWKYARPIKEVKEAWVNIYENEYGLYLSPHTYSSKGNAMSVVNSKNYIKTIRITNEKDGE